MDFPKANLTSAADRSHWVAQTVQEMEERFLDGVNLDFEESIPRFSATLRDAFTALVRELNAAVKAKVPTGQVG